jgi:hypothetical protein
MSLGLSFKLAAIRVLQDAKAPLHIDEITKRALENSLIETSGATPDERCLLKFAAI